jgi:hypothetical protein
MIGNFTPLADGASVMTSKFRVSTAMRDLTTALIAGSSLLLISLAPATAGIGIRALNPHPIPPGLRALNPQPLPPGIYSPNHWYMANRSRRGSNIHMDKHKDW